MIHNFADDEVKMDEEKLVDLVKCNDIIYNPNNKSYNDNTKKEKVWKAIGLELKHPAHICKTRWSNIRDQYRKILKQRKNDPSFEKRKMWKFEEDLSFLQPHFRERRKINDDSTEMEDEGSNNIEEEIKFVNFLPSTITPEETLLNSSAPASTDYFHTFAKRLKQNEESDKKSDDDKLSSILMKYIIEQNKSTQSKHPIDNFFASLAETVKTFSPLYQNTAKLRLFNIVSELEREFLTESQSKQQENFTVTCDPLSLPSSSSFQSEPPDLKRIID